MNNEKEKDSHLKTWGQWLLPEEGAASAKALKQAPVQGAWVGQSRDPHG